MVFGVNINFVPITPGVCPRAEPAPSENTSLKDINIDAYRRELLALRERDMAITKPTQPEYYARPRRPDVQIAAPQPYPVYDDFDFDYDLGLFAPPLPDFTPFNFVSPTDTELECDYAHDERLVESIVDVMYPNGIPSDFDSWAVYHDRPAEGSVPMPPLAEDTDDPMQLDDDAFLEEFERAINSGIDLSSITIDEALLGPIPSSPSADLTSPASESQLSTQNSS